MLQRANHSSNAVIPVSCLPALSPFLTHTLTTLAVHAIHHFLVSSAVSTTSTTAAPDGLPPLSPAKVKLLLFFALFLSSALSAFPTTHGPLKQEQHEEGGQGGELVLEALYGVTCTASDGHRISLAQGCFTPTGVCTHMICYHEVYILEQHVIEASGWIGAGWFTFLSTTISCGEILS